MRECVRQHSVSHKALQKRKGLFTTIRRANIWERTVGSAYINSSHPHSCSEGGAPTRAEQLRTWRSPGSLTAGPVLALCSAPLFWAHYCPGFLISMLKEDLGAIWRALFQPAHSTAWILLGDQKSNLWIRAASLEFRNSKKCENFQRRTSVKEVCCF